MHNDSRAGGAGQTTKSVKCGRGWWDHNGLIRVREQVDDPFAGVESFIVGRQTGIHTRLILNAAGTKKKHK
ncbi:MAG TPA: hypothetical protein VMV54_06275 [Acidocella sp.]|nr:hypothetical protein [Acidocella sp.]